jgi:hypothetical protein
MWLYFIKRLHPVALQNTQFGFANYVGLGAALLFLILLAISNDLSLRNLRYPSLEVDTEVGLCRVWIDGSPRNCVSTHRETPSTLGTGFYLHQYCGNGNSDDCIHADGTVSGALKSPSRQG